jgi:Polyketide cyclase / dehydrase and lipid transport
MGYFEIRVTVDRPLATVFAVYTQADTWRWCSYIRNIRWARGRPWEEESRLQIEIKNTVGGTVDQVLMHFEPNHQVDFVSHFSGITLQTRVTFQALSERKTEIEAQLEFIGVFSRIAGFAVETAIERRTRQFFEDLKQACEQTHAAWAAAGGTGDSGSDFE